MRNGIASISPGAAPESGCTSARPADTPSSPPTRHSTVTPTQTDLTDAAIASPDFASLAPHAAVAEAATAVSACSAAAIARQTSAQTTTQPARPARFATETPPAGKSSARGYSAGRAESAGFHRCLRGNVVRSRGMLHDGVPVQTVARCLQRRSER